jgi:hypothetical protein
LFCPEPIAVTLGCTCPRSRDAPHPCPLGSSFQAQYKKGAAPAPMFEFSPAKAIERLRPISLAIRLVTLKRNHNQISYRRIEGSHSPFDPRLFFSLQRDTTRHNHATWRRSTVPFQAIIRLKFIINFSRFLSSRLACNPWLQQ